MLFAFLYFIIQKQQEGFLWHLFEVQQSKIQFCQELDNSVKKKFEQQQYLNRFLSCLVQFT